jgi:hypothetical protein
MHEGGCDCGQVRYQMAAPIFVNCCHCRMCQRYSGSAFAINAMIEADRVEVTAGEVERVEGSERCPACKVELWAYHRKFGETLRFVRVGTLDRGEEMSPGAHFFTRSKHPWVTLPEGVPAFPTLPGDDGTLWSADAQARVAAALAGNRGGG